jgi:hypothetical protein
MSFDLKNKIMSVTAHYSVDLPSLKSEIPHNEGSGVPALNHQTEKTTTVILWLCVENNSSFVRGKKRSLENIERYYLSNFSMKKLGDCRYELIIPYEDDADLDETIYRLLGEIEGAADLRHCFIEADVMEKGTERSW